MSLIVFARFLDLAVQCISWNFYVMYCSYSTAMDMYMYVVYEYMYMFYCMEIPYPPKNSFKKGAVLCRSIAKVLN